jgi:hypothetical protein
METEAVSADEATVEGGFNYGEIKVSNGNSAKLVTRGRGLHTTPVGIFSR